MPRQTGWAVTVLVRNVRRTSRPTSSAVVPSALVIVVVYVQNAQNDSNKNNHNRRRGGQIMCAVVQPMVLVVRQLASKLK